MNWKDVFSLKGGKKNNEKALDKLDQLDTQLDGSQVTGGAQGGPEVNWIEDAAFGDPKPASPSPTPIEP